MIYLQLFWVYCQIGLFSFGGGYAAVPLIQSRVVEGQGWLTMAQFADLITIAEMTPGPIIINSATFVGRQIAGVSGTIAATAGAVFPSFVIVLILSILYVKYRSLRTMQGILAGLRPAIVAMIGGAGLSLLLLALFDGSVSEVHLSDFRVIEAGLFVVGLFLLRKRKISPILVIFGSGLIGTILYVLQGAV
ncbi:MAG: chromate transporter [Candidatus Choladocola sp.]|nr:chromate transporter [Candidatus Choladocola sp.]